MQRGTEGRTQAIIALCGKGGVGKTALSASIIRALVRDPEKRVLAIDADPAVGLATALAIEVRRTVDEVRTDFIELVKQRAAGDKERVLSLLDYEMLGALHEAGALAFMAIGRPETEGCYCQVNDMLKDIIASIAGNFDYVVIDAEAGVEQVNRRVLERVTHLVLVSDLSAKGLRVAETIHDVAHNAIGFERAGLIVNRLRDGAELDAVPLPASLPFLGAVPEDECIRRADIEARSFLDLPDAPAFAALAECLDKLGIDAGGRAACTAGRHSA
ncbi:MAG TPA: AAA family ATPase [Spirochaetota bacterium]|nr:AAA family ATPase [Spirochaetota bacterium]HOS41089.1 AAA family ATPase [Spirochaetota bacterium]HPI22882.1 AAA family ATPase [Spirochaetota bacterium]HPU90314.1 AAA family ATPase [Spirochaetota bacterium]